MRALWVLLALVAGMLVCPPARAHARSASYSTWWLAGTGASVRVRLSQLDANLLAGIGLRRGPALSEHVSSALRLESRGDACPVVEGTLRELVTEPSFIELEWQVKCSSMDALAVSSNLLVDENPSHLHFTRVAGETSTEGVLDSERRSFAVQATSASEAGGAGFARFIRLGVEHIASGWDHLLFVLMLVMAGATFRRTALVVTGFTVGHSITLALATLGALVPHMGPIEALIGLSIALLAIENVWLEQKRRSVTLPAVAVVAIGVAAIAASFRGAPGAVAFGGVALFAACYFAWVRRAARPEVLRASVAALFGLVHGFGFARVLQEMRLPAADLARGLLGFNLGVELGQLAFIALAFPLVGLARKQQGARSVAVAFAAALGIALGSYWFVLRAFA